MLIIDSIYTEMNLLFSIITSKLAAPVHKSAPLNPLILISNYHYIYIYIYNEIICILTRCIVLKNIITYKKSS